MNDRPLGWAFEASSAKVADGALIRINRNRRKSQANV